ncbi:MAG: alpha/beta hydrolase [Bacteroides sp.]|nr:alpha/beta hydrolase [Bacteroides sp.]
MKKNVTFKNRTIDVAGDLYLPPNFDESRKYAAIVTVHPGSSCKEQTAGIYASKLAERGFVTLSVNASYQGESGGEPRNIEDPAMRVEDIRCAIDYLTTLPYIDEDRIGALGVCAGGGYVVNASMTERRIKAVGTSVGANIGRVNNEGPAEEVIKTLEMISKQRTAEARGAEPLIVPWVPCENKDAEDIDLREAYQYYLTPRGQHPNSTNELRFISMGSVIAFDAFHRIDKLLTQPLQIIVGAKGGAFKSFQDGKELYERAASKEKDLLIFEDASHYDLYDNPRYVDQAVEKFTEFFGKYLK